jgi:dienelactone hydrolase
MRVSGSSWVAGALTSSSNIEVVVYPGVTHGFALPGLIEGDFFGHHMAYDSRVARDAQQRADAFIAAHMGLSPRS